ncbi:MAG: DUF1540 domain-containing protein [Planctomycetota bacterium]
MKMPNVSSCDVTQCAYNANGRCHAMAITIGDGSHPTCDTFCEGGSSSGGDPEAIATVGACKVASCMYNQRLECQADQVRVGYEGDEIDCLTFKRS